MGSKGRGERGKMGRDGGGEREGLGVEKKERDEGVGGGGERRWGVGVWAGGVLKY